MTQTATFSKYFNNEVAGLKRYITDGFKRATCGSAPANMMREDADGRLFFVDRLSNMFCWRSENVSTNKVAVVPVDNNGTSGDRDRLDVAGLARHALANLPRYGVPLFVRVVRQLEYTATKKMQKGRLKAEGVNWQKIREGPGKEDALYWLPPGAEANVPHRREEWESIKSGAAKL